MNYDNIEIVLIKQLKQGTTYNIDEPAVGLSKIPFEIQELEIITDIASKKLKSNGFKELDTEHFNQRIKSIFKRIIDNTLDTKFLYIDFLDRCNKEFVLYNNNRLDYEGIFVDKKNKIITKFYYMPELIDYQKEYPQLTSIENSKIFRKSSIDDLDIEIEHWKDEKDLPNRRHFNEQLLIHRNKYLFNDNKVSLAWLKFNDEYFLESLVKTFGYTQDKDLLNWVMKRNESDAREFVQNNIFVRNCKGELEIREDILKYIEEYTTNDEKTQNYAIELRLYQFENDNNWNEKEIFKIKAYLANTYDFLFKKSDNLGNTNKGRISYLGAIFFNSFRNDNEKSWSILKQNFEQNNYYNLPHLKEVTSYALEFEAFD